MEKVLVHNCRTLESGDTADNWVIFSDRVLKTGNGSSWEQEVFDVSVDAAGGFLTPAMVDTHTHGGNGHSPSSDIDSLRAIRDFQKSQGVYFGVISLVTSDLKEILSLIEIAKAYSAEDPGFLGLHLEGPFLSHDQKGAHDPQLLREPTESELQTIIEAGATAATNIVFSMTVASEMFTSVQLELLTQAGIALCLGHTNSDYHQAKKFFALHGKVLTHAFNAMPGIHHRNPGPVPAAIDNTETYLELIADGIHVDPAVLRLIDPNRVLLVTDSMVATGLEDGQYQLGSLRVTVENSVARTTDGALAGSTLTMPRAVKVYASAIGNKELALKAAIENPLRAYSLKPASLEPGEAARLVLWDEELNLLKTFNL
ncbi:MAG TPA: amidohydrolase family protein [Microbacteriaceae bacterium]